MDTNSMYGVDIMYYNLWLLKIKQPDQSGNNRLKVCKK